MHKPMCHLNEVLLFDPELFETTNSIPHPQ